MFTPAIVPGWPSLLRDRDRTTDHQPLAANLNKPISPSLLF
jgi:hypothetical protein